MQLNALDWFLIFGYCAAAFGIGVYYSKRASANIREFFVAGESLPWWLAGTSIVATTLAADTPLVISGLVRSGGIYKNWFWWSLLMGGMLTVFFYARLWRRAGILTDVEFIELRYDGRAAAVLRGFSAVYNGVLINCITMGWVLLAMVKICEVILGWPKILSIAVMALIALAYTMMSGFWGVVMTDLLQFVIAMAGCFVLAGIVLWDLGGPAGMVERIQATDAFNPEVFSFVPSFQTAGEFAMLTFVVQVTLQWWSGGQGGGYLAQRLFSTKNERHAVLAALWFNFAHYVLRPWPWLIVGLASLVYFPLAAGEDPELAYPKMIVEFMPAGLRGLMVASLLAAFMSTVDTSLNWGSSYLVTDLYKRFLVRDAPDRHYVMAARLSMIPIMLGAVLAAWQSENIATLWIYLMTLTAGAGFVGLLRWFWWRVNAWSEIAALAASFAAANGNLWCAALHRVGFITDSAKASVDWFYGPETYALRLLFIIVVCTAAWLLVTCLTRPVGAIRLEGFYRRVRPGGWWGPIAARCPDVKADRARKGWIGWGAGVVSIYAGLVGFGDLCLGNYLGGLILLLVAGLAGWLTLVQIPWEEDKVQ